MDFSDMVSFLESGLDLLEDFISSLSEDLDLRDDPLEYKYLAVESRILKRTGGKRLLLRAFDRLPGDGYGEENGEKKLSRVIALASTDEEMRKVDLLYMAHRVYRDLERVLGYIRTINRMCEESGFT